MTLSTWLPWTLGGLCLLLLICWLVQILKTLTARLERDRARTQRDRARTQRDSAREEHKAALRVNKEFRSDCMSRMKIMRRVVDSLYEQCNGPIDERYKYASEAERAESYPQERLNGHENGISSKRTDDLTRATLSILALTEAHNILLHQAAPRWGIRFPFSQSENDDDNLKRLTNFIEKCQDLSVDTSEFDQFLLPLPTSQLVDPGDGTGNSGNTTS